MLLQAASLWMPLDLYLGQLPQRWSPSKDFRRSLVKFQHSLVSMEITWTQGGVLDLPYIFVGTQASNAESFQLVSKVVRRQLSCRRTWRRRRLARPRMP